MLDLTLAGLGGCLLGAGLTYIWCRTHPRGDAAEVARLTRELEGMHQRAMEREAQLWARLTGRHQAIVVDRRTDQDG